MQPTGKSEFFIQNVIGCGPFQVIHILLVFLVTKPCSVFVMMFMSFGNYNPGWRCLDGNHSVAGDFIKDNCSLFTSCDTIEFDPETSTIVSEWQLLCEKKWIPSTIISIQMVGILFGCFLAGYLGDAYGRKVTIYGAQAVMTVLNVVTVFSTSWEMFAALRFFLGMSTSCIISLYYVYTVEFVTLRWRAPIPNIPFWPLTCILFAICCMYLRDWRDIHIVAAIIGAVGFVPVIWIPESLRWLEVNDKWIKFERVATKIAKLNKKSLPSIDDIKVGIVEDKDTKTYNIRHIFMKEYRRNTILLSVPWFIMSLVFYSLSFGVKALSGNIYVNLILMYALEIPFTIVPIFAPNLLGRRSSGIVFSVASGLCLLAAAILNQSESGGAQTNGVLVLALSGRIILGGFWGIMMIHTVEIFPTAIRALGYSWCSIVARIGGIIAPFLIPSEPGAFFTCYVIMGCLCLVCCIVVFKLPETRGKTLQELFVEDIEDSGTQKDI